MSHNDHNDHFLGLKSENINTVQVTSTSPMFSNHANI